MNNPVVSRLGSEALGTMFFVFLGAGAVVSVGMLGLGAAIGWALALAVAVWIFGAGGAHFNPFVTIGLALRGRFAWAAVPGHVIAQLIGGFLGSLLVWALYSSAAFGVGPGETMLGQTVLNPTVEGGDYIGALAAEALVTLALLMVVFNLIGRGGWKYGLGYGLTYGVGVLAIGAITGGSMNFARTFGAELSLSIAESDLADWGNIWVYLVGPLVGVVLAWLVHPLVSSEPASES